ncbi:helix-turn-helix transcriptional regulator [Fibrella aquatilis]|uniref:Helix-turn-helix transcriptional regulator n=1 Tax=Fibrella aquatilis TaxID=2817059 RepID=A0A939G1A2_9BACT|nr:helix-turn-helix transcriptional regulator [Fibrella aquatilis]MBO0930582.1 helix-turn-helix transcriptional regulator [Fibrella aquatilis]
MKNRLKVARAEHNLSQAELAERIGVSRQTINSIETGRYVPSTVLALKLAAVFTQSVEALFSLEDVD